MVIHLSRPVPLGTEIETHCEKCRRITTHVFQRASPNYRLQCRACGHCETVKPKSAVAAALRKDGVA